MFTTKFTKLFSKCIKLLSTICIIPFNWNQITNTLIPANQKTIKYTWFHVAHLILYFLYLLVQCFTTQILSSKDYVAIVLTFVFILSYFIAIVQGIILVSQREQIVWLYNQLSRVYGQLVRKYLKCDAFFTHA